MQEYFKAIEDTRHQSYIKHRLCDILVMIMCAVLCGLDDLGTVMVYIQNQADFFEQNFGIKETPSKPTVSRVLRMIDGQQVAEVIIRIMREKIGESGDVIAVDGKAIRSTSKDGETHSALQIITAYLTESGLVLGQEKIHEKTNEIPTFQKMLSYLNVSGKTVTADAMHCQKETCKLIVSKGGDYLFGLKENQKTLHDDVALYFQNPPDDAEIQIFSTSEKNGGRIEKRICRKTTQIKWLCNRDKWPGLNTILEVERVVTYKGKTTRERSYYISSCADASAEQLLSIVREHWMIESLHWMLDVVFSEDDCALQSEEAQITLNCFRKCALLLHRHYLSTLSKKLSVKSNMLNCLMNNSLLLNVISC